MYEQHDKRTIQIKQAKNLNNNHYDLKVIKRALNDFGLKGIIDNVVIDPKNEIVFINDLKTTNKNLQDFPETVEYYRYWMQAVIYKKLVQQTIWEKEDLNSLRQYDVYDYKFIITFVVVDKFNQVYPFQVSQNTLNDRYNRHRYIEII